MTAPDAREAAVALLLDAGFTQHTAPPRRRSDPAPADGFRVFHILDSLRRPTGSVLVAWVPVGGGDHKKPGQLAESRKMAEEYAAAAADAGWAAEFEGEIWHHVRLTSAAVPGD